MFKKEGKKLTSKGQMLVAGTWWGAPKVPHTTSLPKSPMLNS